MVFCNTKDKRVHTVHPALAALREELVREHDDAGEVVASRVALIVAEGDAVMEGASESMRRLLHDPLQQV